MKLNYKLKDSTVFTTVIILGYLVIAVEALLFVKRISKEDFIGCILSIVVIGIWTFNIKMCKKIRNHLKEEGR